MVLLSLLALATVTSIIAISVYLYKDNRRSRQFTAQLETLAKRGADVVPPELAPPASEGQNFAADVQQIQSLYEKHNDAWCRGDGKAYASVFTADADFIAFDGTRTTRRDEIAASHQNLFDRYLRNTCLQGVIERIKFVSADVAIALVRSGTRFDDNSIVRRPSIQTYVAVRQGDRWMFTSFHNSRIDPVQDRSVLRLAWLGTKTWLFRR